MDQTLGKRIAANRKSLGLTQEQLAEKLGVTAQAVSKWENDQSCPDISILPRLAQVFGISTDALLGCEEKEKIVHEAQVVEEDEPEGVHIQSGNWDFSFSNGKRSAVGTAVFVIIVGALYLLAQIYSWNVNFWQILWPTALMVFGLWGISKKFAFVPLVCSLIGAFFLVDNLHPMGLDIKSGYIWAILIVLFGISLLADALKKKKRPFFSVRPNEKHSHSKMHQHSVREAHYKPGEDSFDYSASFGETTEYIELPRLRFGEVNTSFGEYRIDLSGVASVAENCTIDANCSFGELIFLVPRKYHVKPDCSTAFASVSVEGQPDPQPAGIIYLDANASFGQILIEYI